MILYNGDTKCDWLDPDVVVFLFYICLFYLTWGHSGGTNIPNVKNLALNEDFYEKATYNILHRSFIMNKSTWKSWGGLALNS